MAARFFVGVVLSSVIIKSRGNMKGELVFVLVMYLFINILWVNVLLLFLLVPEEGCGRCL